ncbi:SNARE associated Golgi protein [Peptoclostridium litorale DSM 5388]|uniref:TVP38/TMEM64 family membrane protein n=2 Tax=Peptoclostridium litorale TaxID=1557 RepID=A0A069REM4_PEPLI|nr:hypothetical protein CLIT_10c02180 [Peptoclostridium litorale DSM 5388]SIO17568.1 SNARE associated Golgi protein [Peptoclostridium litorale DSM 5388]
MSKHFKIITILFTFILLLYLSKQLELNEILTFENIYANKMRLIPILPFFFIHVAAGLTNIPLPTFIWTTSLGTIPGTFDYVFAGHNITNIKHGSQILSPNVVAAFVIFGIITIGPTLIKSTKKKKIKMANSCSNASSKP